MPIVTKYLTYANGHIIIIVPNGTMEVFMLKGVRLIEEYRKREGLSRISFCKRCKVTMLVLKKLESGSLEIGVTSAVRIVKVLGVTLSEFCVQE